jgi:hypothetical protein
MKTIVLMALLTLSGAATADYWLQVETLGYRKYAAQKPYIALSDCLKEMNWLSDVLRKLNTDPVRLSCVDQGTE